jgi:hypothetical protein
VQEPTTQTFWRKRHVEGFGRKSADRSADAVSRVRTWTWTEHAIRHLNAWFVAAIAWMPLSARCYEFQVAGHLCVSNYLRGSTLSTQSYDFELSVSNHLWHLRAVDYNARAARDSETEHRLTTRSPQYRQDTHNKQRKLSSLVMLAGTDGTSVYGFSTLRDETERSTLQGFATHGSKPQFNRDLRLIWMAFASSAYLNMPTNLSTLQPPWDIYPSENKDYSLKSEIERDSVPPNLPLKILFHTTRAPGVSQSDSKERLVGRYWVLSRTNYAGLSIPTTCVLERFSSKATNILLSSYSLEAVSVHKPTVISYVPQPTKGMLVLDYRFTDASIHYDFTPYYVQDGWRNESDQGLVQLAESRKSSLRNGSAAVGGGASARRKVWSIVLSITLVVPALIFGYRTVKSRTKTK